MKKCDCDERIGIKINSWKQFQELKEFFEGQVEKSVFIELPVDKPYSMIGRSYADKWYKCLECGVLWEFKYPDFPAIGFVRKISSGEYHMINYDKRNHMILNE